MEDDEDADVDQMDEEQLQEALQKMEQEEAPQVEKVGAPTFWPPPPCCDNDSCLLPS